MTGAVEFHEEDRQATAVLDDGSTLQIALLGVYGYDEDPARATRRSTSTA